MIRRKTDKPEVVEPPVEEPKETKPEFTLNASSKESNIPEELQNVEVTFAKEDNAVKATYQDLPEGYKPKGRLYLGNALVGMMKGRLEVLEESDSVSYIFGKGYATTNEYKFEARVQKTSDKSYTTLATQTFNVNEVAYDSDEL